MSSRVLVIGGTGMLGLPVARQLQADGYQVTIMTSSLERARARLGDEFQLVAGDVTQPETLVDPIAGNDIVYLNLNAKRDPILYENLEIRGTMNVVWTARRSDVKRVAMISGASSEGREEGIIFFDAKVKAEKALIESTVPYTIMRPSWFFESLPHFIQNGRATVIGNQPIGRGWLAAKDYARQVSVALQSDDAANKCFYNLGPQKMTILEALKAFCARHYPEIKPTDMSLTRAKLLSLLPGMKALKGALPFFKYFETRPEDGSPVEAEQILGPNLTTLEEWLDGYQPGK